MERTVKIDTEAILWKKEGGGSFHANIGGKVMIIKPGQQFMARPDDIPVAFRDMVVPVDPIGAAKAIAKKEVEAAKATAPKYSLQDRGGSWWDVITEDGKVQNERALRKPAAEELLASLT